MITVVDNGSTDGSIGAIASRHPAVRLLPLGANHGFTGGVAAGLARSQARNVVFLNNDAVPEPGWLKALVDAIEGAPDDVMSIGGKIVDPTGQLIDFIGGALTFDGHAFQNGFRYPLASREEPRTGAEILFACGGNMISRREPLVALGGFDDDYFAYLEDVDFGWRSWLAGFRVLFEPRAVVRHKSSATSQRLGDFERGVLFERNALQTALKNYEALHDAAGSLFFTFSLATPPLCDHAQRRCRRAVARAVLEDIKVIARPPGSRASETVRRETAGDDRRSADGDAVPRLRVDRRTRQPHRRETRRRAEPAETKRPRDLRTLPAGDRADLSRR